MFGKVWRHIGSNQKNAKQHLKILDCSGQTNSCALPNESLSYEVVIDQYDFLNYSGQTDWASDVWSSVGRVFSKLKSFSPVELELQEIFALQTFSLMVNESELTEILTRDTIMKHEAEKYDVFIFDYDFSIPKRPSFGKRYAKIIKNMVYLFFVFFRSLTQKIKILEKSQSCSYFYEIPHRRRKSGRSYFFEESSDFCSSKKTNNLRLLFDDLGYVGSNGPSDKTSLPMSKFFTIRCVCRCLISFFKLVRSVRKLLLHDDGLIARSLEIDLCSTGTMTNLIYYHSFVELFRREQLSRRTFELTIPFEGKPLEKMALLAEKSVYDETSRVRLNSIYPLAKKHLAFDTKAIFWRQGLHSLRISTVKESNVKLLKYFGWNDVRLDRGDYSAIERQRLIRRSAVGMRILVCLTMSDKCNRFFRDQLCEGFSELCATHHVRIRPHPFLSDDWISEWKSLSPSWSVSDEESAAIALDDVDVVMFGDNSVGYESLNSPVLRIYVVDTSFYSGNRIEEFEDFYLDRFTGLEFLLGRNLETPELVKWLTSSA